MKIPNRGINNIKNDANEMKAMLKYSDASLYLSATSSIE